MIISKQLTRCDIFHFIAYARQVLLEGGLGDDYRAATVIGVEAQGRSVFQSAVEKENDVVLGVVDESERTDAAGFETKIAHHPLRRGKGQFAGCLHALRDENILEPVLNVMNRQIVVAMEADEVVLVALVVAHEYVLAMHAPVVVPPALGFLYRLAFRVIVGREGDVMFAQIAQHALLTFGYYFVIFH